jgi:hypothetical protein
MLLVITLFGRLIFASHLENLQNVERKVSLEIEFFTGE